MRIIPFPDRGDVGPDQNWLSELELALSGAGNDQRAESWRQLREDVRALAAPMSPEFERELRGRIAGWESRPSTKGPGRWWGWILRPRLLATGTAGIAGVLVALLLITEPRTGNPAQQTPSPRVAATAAPRLASAPQRTTNDFLKASASAATAGASASAASIQGSQSGAGTAVPPGRIQQLSASITLACAPASVQETADRVSQVIESDGGYVQSSHVNVGQGSGEANITLSLPSAKLNSALASLGRIAAVRAQSQSLQDITSSYDSARQQLADAAAERKALLRALAKATSEGQIDSLHERLSQNRTRIAQDHGALQTISQHASTSEVEVTVLGDANAGKEGLTLHRGLHDAGRVLVVTLVVLLIMAAVLVPLALVIAISAVARGAWRRHQRERVLEGS
jgi:hypothetical protein